MNDIELFYKVQQFLFYEAELLDNWLLDQWLTIFSENSMYVIPTTDHRKPNLNQDLTLVCDDINRLKARVQSLMGNKAWAENPPSRTKRIISNIRIAHYEHNHIKVNSNFVIYRFKNNMRSMFIGCYTHEFEIDKSNNFKITKRTATLDDESLETQGMISIIL